MVNRPIFSYALKLNAELNGAQRVHHGKGVQNHAHLLVVHGEERAVEDLRVSTARHIDRITVVLPLRKNGVVGQTDGEGAEEITELWMIKRPLHAHR